MTQFTGCKSPGCDQAVIVGMDYCSPTCLSNRGSDLKPSTKLRFSLLPLYALRGVVRAFMDGADKYAAWDWQKAEEPTKYLDAAMRHISKMGRADQPTQMVPDSDRNVTHLDAAIASLIIYKVLTEYPTTANEES